MIKKTIEERFKKLTPREHILKRPGMYIGNIYTEPTKMFVFDDINEIKASKFTNKIVEYNAGFIKLYDEILTNASDHYIRTGQVKYIKIHIEKDHISVENDGPGIPIEMHKEHKMYVPEMVFQLNAGENFDDEEKRMVGGTHGLGASLVNIFSTKFIIETADGKNKENNFRTTELMMSMSSALNFDEKYKNLNDVEKFIKNFDIVCSSLSESRSKNSGFYWEYYAPYFIEMHEKKLVETFAYIIFSSSDESYIAKWLKKHNKEVEEFNEWSKGFEWKRK